METAFPLIRPDGTAAIKAVDVLNDALAAATAGISV
jgi:hypothetical protein